MREPLTLEVEHITYIVEPVQKLDANLESCLPAHRDRLLDARSLLYPNTPTDLGATDDAQP